MASNCPLPAARLRQICADACTATLGASTHYDHSQTAAWNNGIIGAVLQAVIAESSEASSDEAAAPQYKWIVNTTIIQHLTEPRSAADGPVKKVGRRGMHSASGAFWNNDKDGMWSYKHDAAGERGMDVVVSVMWIAA